MNDSSMLRMPAEWESHEAIWLAWPHNQEDWPGKFAPIPWVYVEIIRHCTRHVRVRLLIKNERQHREAIACLEKAGIDLGNVDFHLVPTDRVWLRDSGPTFVYRGEERVLLDWKFNAWAKYDNWKRDTKVPAFVSTTLGLPLIQPKTTVKGVERRVVLEGGSIDVNGQGTLLTTEECLLSDVQCRNPGLDRAGYERIFYDYLGISNAIWLGDGIVGDDTHGHVDDLARFVNASTVVTAVESSPSDANYSRLQDNLKRLQSARDQSGKALTVAELPMPAPVLFEGQRLPASYANFLITNGLVLVPTFNDRNDRVALDILSELFPGREVIGVYCGDFVWGLGTIHCASQQEIAAISASADGLPADTGA